MHQYKHSKRENSRRKTHEKRWKSFHSQCIPLISSRHSSCFLFQYQKSWFKKLTESKNEICQIKVQFSTVSPFNNHLSSFGEGKIADSPQMNVKLFSTSGIHTVHTLHPYLAGRWTTLFGSRKGRYLLFMMMINSSRLIRPSSSRSPSRIMSSTSSWGRVRIMGLGRRAGLESCSHWLITSPVTHWPKWRTLTDSWPFPNHEPQSCVRRGLASLEAAHSSRCTHCRPCPEPWMPALCCPPLPR